MINLPQIDQVPSNCLLGTLYQEEVAYYYHLDNVITFSLSQSDHIKRLPLYVIVLRHNGELFFKSIRKQFISSSISNFSSFSMEDIGEQVQRST